MNKIKLIKGSKNSKILNRPNSNPTIKKSRLEKNSLRYMKPCLTITIQNCKKKASVPFSANQIVKKNLHNYHHLLKTLFLGFF